MKIFNQQAATIASALIFSSAAFSTDSIATESHAYTSNEPLVQIDLGRASAFNLVAFGDFGSPTFSSVTHSIAVEGNVQLGDYGFSTKIAPNAPTIAAYIGGDFSFRQGQIYGGSVLVAGSANGVDASVRREFSDSQWLLENVDVGVDFDTWQIELTQKAQSLSDIAANGSAEFKWGGYYLEGDCESDLQVFNLDGNNLKQANAFKLECVPDNAAVLINISGQQSGMRFLKTDATKNLRHKTLFNFFEATQLEFNRVEIHGTVLAPQADVENPTGTLFGSAITARWNGPMLLEWEPYQGHNVGSFVCP